MIGAATTGVAGPVIADVVAAEVETARTRAASLQARGLAVISSSGTLVTLLFGLSALATKAQDFTLPASAKLPLILAASLLVLAAVAGIWTNAPRKVDGIALTDLDPLIEEKYWNHPDATARQRVAKTQLRVAKAERSMNGSVARKLLAGIILEIVGIACVAWAVIALIAGS